MADPQKVSENLRKQMKTQKSTPRTQTQEPQRMMKWLQKKLYKMGLAKTPNLEG